MRRQLFAPTKTFWVFALENIFWMFVPTIIFQGAAACWGTRGGKRDARTMIVGLSTGEMVYCADTRKMI